MTVQGIADILGSGTTSDHTDAANPTVTFNLATYQESGDGAGEITTQGINGALGFGAYDDVAVSMPDAAGIDDNVAGIVFSMCRMIEQHQELTQSETETLRVARQTPQYVSINGTVLERHRYYVDIYTEPNTFDVDNI